MYKLSKYNYFVSYRQHVIYFNGLSGKLFSISQEDHDTLLEFFENLPLFQECDPSSFDQFKNLGFILEENVSEIDILRFRNRQATFSDMFYRLIINPTEDCIFDCWYCTAHKKNTGRMHEDVIEKIKRHLEIMITNKKITGLFLDWFGGEPLMYFNEVVCPISMHALELTSKYNLPFKHHVTTNAYLIDKEMVKKMHEIKLRSFQITLDGDENRHDKIRNASGRPSYKKILESIHLILENIPDAQIILRINFDDATLQVSNMQAVFESIPSKYRHRIYPNFIRVWQTAKPGLMSENEQIKELISFVRNVGYANPNPSNAFIVGKALRCSGDKLYQCVVNYDGKVHKCTAHTKKEMGVLHENGVITWNEELISCLYATPTFENDKCLSCKYLPICLSTCTQHRNRNTKDAPYSCPLDYTEVSVDNFIIRLYENQLHSKSKKHEL